ncbi:MAG: glycosyltransferase family 39 protein [Endomicrobiia bacterium]
MKKIITFFTKPKIQFITILIFASFGMFAKLGITELQPMGSATHAAVAREILRTNDWLTLHWPFVGEFYQFPPLFFWLQAITFKIFGISDLTAKLTSSFFGFMVILITYYLGKLLVDDYTGFLSSMTLILTPYFFRHSRKCELETILIFFITLGIIFFVLSEQKNNNKFLLLTGLSTGLGFLAKGPPAFAVWGTIFIYYIITKQYKKLFNFYFIVGILISILVPFTWIIPQIIYRGDAFYKGFVINQVLGKIYGGDRPATTFVEKILNYTFFFRAFYSHYLPWSITGIFGIVKIFKKNLKNLYVLVIWVIVVWIGFTLPGYKDDYYLLAMFPGWAVINGFIFKYWTEKISKQIYFYSSILAITFVVVTIFTPIKFDKVRNPEFKILSQHIKQVVPSDQRIITYNLYPYDMMSLFPWYMDRGVVPLNTEKELLQLVSSSETKFVFMKIEDYKNLSSNILLHPVFYCGRFVFASNIKISEPKIINL